MKQTWNFVWNRLFDDRTGMFYNHLAGDDAHATKYLTMALGYGICIYMYKEIKK